MPALTSGELDLLRANYHRARFYLSISIPRVLLSAQVAGSPAQGAQTFNYDNGTGTGFGDIEENQILRVVTATGTETVRVKSISGTQTSGSVTIAANSIVWEDNQDFDILEDYPLRPKPPRFTASGFFKDWNVVYPGGGVKPVTIGGPHRPKFLSGGSAVFDVDLTDSYAVAQGATMTAVSYSATVTPSAGVTVSLTNGVGTITVTNAGQYWVEFSGTDSNGKSQITKRRYFVHDPDPTDADYPYSDFEIQTLGGDWERGGWTLGIKVNGVADPDAFPEEALVCLWYTVDYDGTEQYIGQPDGILFCGYIRKGTVVANWETSDVQFEAQTIEALLRNISMRDVVLEATGSPVEWYQYDGTLTTGRALRHYWGEHSTLFECADVIGLVDDTTRRAVANFNKGDLYSQAESVSREYGIVAHAVCNKAGQMHLVRDLQYRSDADRAAAAVTCELLKQDRHGDITLIDRPTKSAAMCFGQGFIFDGTFTGGIPNVSVVCSKAPGDVPEDQGVAFIDKPNQIVAGQAGLNSLTGREMAVANNVEPEARVNFDGIWAGVLDIIGDEWFQMDMAAADNSRGTSWTNKLLVCRTVNNRVDPVNGYIASDAALEPEAEGPPGVTDTCPGFPASIEPDGPDWTPPTGIFLFAYQDGDATASGAGKIVAGTVASGGITLGGVQTFDTNSVASPATCGLSSTKGLVAWYDQADGRVEVRTVNLTGTTIDSFGSPLLVASVTGGSITLIPFTETSAVIAFKNSGTGNLDTYALSVSGDTITKGTVGSIEGVKNRFGGTRLTDTKGALAYVRSSDNALRAVIVDVSGTTITPGTPASIGSITATQCGIGNAGSAAGIIAYEDVSNNDLRAVAIYNISGTTFSNGSPTSVDTENIDTGTGAQMVSPLDEASKVVVAYNPYVTAPNPYTLKAVAIEHTGSGNVSAGSPVLLSSSATSGKDRLAACVTRVDLSGTAAVGYVHVDEASSVSGAYVRSVSVSGTTLEDGGDEEQSDADIGTTGVGWSEAAIGVLTLPGQ